MNKRKLIFSVIICMVMVFQFCKDKPDQENVPEQKPVPLNISQNSGTFNESFAKLLQTYFSLKDAFISADTVKVNSAAVLLIRHADSLNINELKGDSSGMILETANYFASAISGSAKTLTNEYQIQDKLREFNMITDAMWGLTRRVKYEGQKGYYQFCPLAFDNTGGYWLSDKIDPDNPYVRDKAKSCSQVNDSLDYGKR